MSRKQKLQNVIRLLLAFMSLISVAKSLGAFAVNTTKGTCLDVKSANRTWGAQHVIRLDYIFHTCRCFFYVFKGNMAVEWWLLQLINQLVDSLVHDFVTQLERIVVYRDRDRKIDRAFIMVLVRIATDLTHLILGWLNASKAGTFIWACFRKCRVNLTKPSRNRSLSFLILTVNSDRLAFLTNICGLLAHINVTMVL